LREQLQLARVLVQLHTDRADNGAALGDHYGPIGLHDVLVVQHVQELGLGAHRTMLRHAVAHQHDVAVEEALFAVLGEHAAVRSRDEPSAVFREMHHARVEDFGGIVVRKVEHLRRREGRFGLAVLAQVVDAEIFDDRIGLVARRPGVPGRTALNGILQKERDGGEQEHQAQRQGVRGAKSHASVLPVARARLFCACMMNSHTSRAAPRPAAVRAT
jgi:hypothetical protein